MENQLLQLYLFVCQIYDTRSQTCFGRASNNSKPKFTDQELVCIWFFGHLEGKFTNQQIYDFIENYWAEWFPRLPSYQTRLVSVEPGRANFSNQRGGVV